MKTTSARNQAVNSATHPGTGPARWFNLWLAPVLLHTTPLGPLLKNFIALKKFKHLYPWRPFYEQCVFAWFKSCNNSICSDSYHNDPIRSQLCICYDSCGDVSCAELWPHLFLLKIATHFFLQDFDYNLNYSWNSCLNNALKCCWQNWHESPSEPVCRVI